MKKYLYILLILPIFLSCNQKKSIAAYDNSWAYVEMTEQTIGTYLPTEFIETLNNTKSYVKAMKSQPNGNHIIAVEKNIVYTNYDYWDQAAYLKEKVENFIFENDDNKMTLVYDGNKYLQISTSPDYYLVMIPFVLKTIFEDYKNVNFISYNKIKISNEIFTFLPSILFYEYETIPDLFLSDGENQYSCRIHDGKMELRELEETSLMTSKESKEIAKSFILK